VKYISGALDISAIFVPTSYEISPSHLLLDCTNRSKLIASFNMTVNRKAIDSPNGQYVAAGIDMSDLFPAPFPTNVKTVHLETLSLAKLLQRDEDELRRIYENCRDPGFFQLDLTDDEQGVQLLRDAVDCARLMKQLLPNMSVEEKRTYKQHSRVGVYSKGYGLA
jgi:hypothetical protein